MTQVMDRQLILKNAYDFTVCIIVYFAVHAIMEDPVAIMTGRFSYPGFDAEGRIFLFIYASYHQIRITTNHLYSDNDEYRSEAIVGLWLFFITFIIFLFIVLDAPDGNELVGFCLIYIIAALIVIFLTIVNFYITQNKKPILPIHS